MKKLQLLKKLWFGALWNFVNNCNLLNYLQVNWSSGANSCQNSHGHAQLPPAYPNYNSTAQNFCPQPYSATYSFAADFRPEPPLDPFRSQWMPNTSSIITPTSSLSSSNTRGYASPTNSTPKRQKSTRKLCAKIKVLIAHKIWLLYSIHVYLFFLFWN